MDEGPRGTGRPRIPERPWSERNRAALTGLMAIVISVVLLIIISVYLLRTGQHVLLTFILAFAVFGFSSISYLIVSGWLFQGRLDKDIILRE